MAHQFDPIAQWFDLFFAIGLGALAVLYMFFRVIPGKDGGLSNWVLLGYYAFFALFCLAAFFGIEKQRVYFGFLNSVTYQSLFYLL